MKLRSGFNKEIEKVNVRPRDIIRRKTKKLAKSVNADKKSIGKLKVDDETTQPGSSTSTQKKKVVSVVSQNCIGSRRSTHTPRGRPNEPMNNNNNTVNDTARLTVPNNTALGALSPNTTRQALQAPLPDFDESERETENETEDEEEEHIENRAPANRRKIMEYIKRPEILNTSGGNLSENWKNFKRDLDIYMVATESDGKAAKIKVALFLNLIGRDALKLFDTFALTQPQKESYEEVIKSFEDFCKPKKNSIFERYMFISRSQKEGESFDSFLMEIKRLSSTCEYGANEKEMLRDRIVHGITNKDMQRKLLTMGDLTCDQAIEKCRAAEVTREQTASMNKTTASVNEMHTKNDTHKQSNGNRSFSNNNNNNGNRGNRNAFNGNSRNYSNQNNNKNKGNKNFRSQQSQNKSNGNNSNSCRFCNFKHNKGECPAYGKVCRACSKKNHFESVCRSRNVNAINGEDFDQRNNDDFYANSLTQMTKRNVHAVDIGVKPCWKENLKINNKVVAFKVDTGSDVPTLTRRLLDVIAPGAELKPSEKVLRAFGGGVVKPIGVCRLKCAYEKGKRVMHRYIDFEIVDVETVPLLGLVEAVRFGWIDLNRVGDYKTRKQLEHFL